jgi:hypothetical protein
LSSLTILSGNVVPPAPVTTEDIAQEFAACQSQTIKTDYAAVQNETNLIEDD